MILTQLIDHLQAFWREFRIPFTRKTTVYCSFTNCKWCGHFGCEKGYIALMKSEVHPGYLTCLHYERNLENIPIRQQSNLKLQVLPT